MDKKLITLVSFGLVLVLMGMALGPVYGEQPQRQTTLRMGLLPILDVLPFYVAEEAGYFEAQGVNIELV
ncbi:MAG: metal ABC transporter substrate-binding protein, partial [Chloroflexi bacterium]|nr:metal ABC transporter substrate-binding protein [Chloroflexota bacterium]